MSNLKPVLCRDKSDVGPGAFCVRCGRIPRGKENEIQLVWVPLCSKCCAELNWPHRVEKDLHTPAPLMQIGKTYNSFMDLIGEKTFYQAYAQNIPEHYSYVWTVVNQGLTNSDVRARYGQVFDIPQQYWHASLQQFGQTPGGYFVLPSDWASCIVNLSNGWVNVIAVGVSGTGKSHLAAAWLYTLTATAVCQRWTAKWIHMGNFLAQLRQTYNKDSETYGQGDAMIQSVVDTDVLVIDELACEHLSQHGLQTVLQIIEGRLNRTCSTFVTSNNTVDEFNSREQRIGSRLGSFWQIPVQGLDRRQDPMVQQSPLPHLPAEPKPQSEGDDDFEYTIQDAYKAYQDILQLEQQTGEYADLQRWALLRLLECEHIPVEHVVPQGQILYQHRSDA